MADRTMLDEAAEAASEHVMRGGAIPRDLVALVLCIAADRIDQAADEHNADIARIARVPQRRHDTGTSHGLRRAARLLREGMTDG